MTALKTRTYRLVVAPLNILSSTAVVSVDPNTGNPVVTEPVNAPKNETEQGLDLSKLDFKFKVKRTLRAKPNTAAIIVYGLSAKSALYFATPKKLAVSLEVGYDGENELIFLGECRNSYTLHEGPETTTVIETGDSEKVMQAAGLKLTWGSPTINISHAIQAIQQTIPQIMSGSQVNAWAKQNAVLATVNATVLHPKGGAVDRKSVRYLDDICQSAGLEWSVQNGEVFILPKGQALQGQEIVLSESSGLIGSPSVSKNGFLDVKSLILKGLHPGALIRVDARNVQGDYRIESVEYEGGTPAGHREWYAKMLCVNPKNAPGQKLGFNTDE